MLSALFTQLLVSFLTKNLLGKGYFPRWCDILSVYSPGKIENQTRVIQSSSGAALIDSTINVSCIKIHNLQTTVTIKLIHFLHER